MRYEIDVFGDEEVREELDDLGERARDMRRVFLAVLRFVVVPRFKDRFSGAGWAPLAQATMDRKSRQGLDPRVMRATGAAEDALTGFGRTRGVTQTVGKTTLRRGVGKSLFYLRFQHFGAGKIPARPLFGWEPADKAKALKLIDQHLFGGGKLT